MTAPRSLEERSHAELQELVRRQADALRKLSDEALGNLVAFENGMRAAIGNTNFAVLYQRANEARALLAETPDE